MGRGSPTFRRMDNSNSLKLMGKAETTMEDGAGPHPGPEAPDTARTALALCSGVRSLVSPAPHLPSALQAHSLFIHLCPRGRGAVLWE